MDPHIPGSISSHKPLEILRQQIGDLHLSLRLPQNQTDLPFGQGLHGLEQLINHAGIGLYRSTVAGQLVMANAVLARIFGYDSPEDMMEHVTDIETQLYVEPKRRKDWRHIIENQDIMAPVLWRGHRHNHDVLWLEEQARVIRDSHGRILGYEGIVCNVTERYNSKPLSQHAGQKVELVEKADVSEGGGTNAQLRQELADAQQMIASLREQLDRFDIATKGSREGLWESRPLPGQPWNSPDAPAWYSTQFKALLGFEDHEFPPVLQSWASRIHPEDRDGVFQALSDHIEHHVPYDVESRLRTKQGEYRWFKGKGQAIFDQQGIFVRGGGTIRDITDQKKAEEALKESQERYRALYDQTPLLYLTVDVQLTILSVNQFGADMLGYAVQELVGQSMGAVLDPDDRDVIMADMEKSFTVVNTVSQRELRNVKKDGTIFWVKETWQTIPGPNQQPMLLLSCEDITARKRAEEALEKSEKHLRHTQKMEAIGTLAGGIAHDFNNILSAILGYSELALAQIPKESRLLPYLEEIFTAGNRAKDLVKQILAFSRRSDQEREAVDLQHIVQEALGMVRATLPSTIEIRSILVIDSAVIFADPTQIHQVIMNLCTNAEQAMREEGGVLSIAVTSREVTEGSIHAFPGLQPGTYLQLSIQDSGKGMPGHVLDRIFEPFFTTKELGQGTGLGLAVVHGIIVGHEGHISVKSVVGQGTTFTILFPRLDVALPVKPEKVLEWPRGTGKVLFVDDEEVLARWGEQVLTHLGYTVITKTNPHEAVEVFQEEPDAFDVVVTDQTMPLMSGEVFARTLLNIREDIPIVLCTGFSHTMSAEKAKKLGLQGFLMKPVNGAVLAKTLWDILSKSEEK